MRKGFTEIDQDTVTVPIEDIWKRVRRWAKRNHKEYVATYGVVGEAPT